MNNFEKKSLLFFFYIENQKIHPWAPFEKQLYDLESILKASYSRMTPKVDYRNRIFDENPKVDFGEAHVLLPNGAWPRRPPMSGSL